MFQFVKYFASFALALVLSSVSWVPCFANVGPNDVVVTADNAVCSVGISQYTAPLIGDFVAPLNVYSVIPVLDSVRADTPLSPYFQTTSQFLFEEDKTLYWNIYPVVGSDLNAHSTISSKVSNLTSSLPVFRVGVSYLSSEQSSSVITPTVTRVALGDENFQGVYSNTYHVTIPSKSPSGNYYNNFDCYYPHTSSTWFWTSSVSGGLSFVVDMFQFVDTADSGILTVLDQILAEAQEANLNLSNILAACNQILVELQSLNTDTDTIIEMLTAIRNSNSLQLNRLTYIMQSVDAIYYFLTEEMKQQSDELSTEAAAVAGAIDNNDQAEAYYQSSMQGSYDALDLDNFSFGGITGGLELVGTVFSDIWAAWGEYSILFTYPLILGIALLVIGRLSKHSGGSSSRDSEHKGGNDSA